MKEGKWYFVTWVDAHATLDSDAKKGDVEARQLPGLYVATKTRSVLGKRVMYHVFARSVDEGGDLSSSDVFTVPVGDVVRAEPLAVRTPTIPKGEDK